MGLPDGVGCLSVSSNQDEILDGLAESRSLIKILLTYIFLPL